MPFFKRTVHVLPPSVMTGIASAVFGITFDPVERYSNWYSASKIAEVTRVEYRSVPCCGSRLVMSLDERRRTLCMSAAAIALPEPAPASANSISTTTDDRDSGVTMDSSWVGSFNRERQARLYTDD